MHWIESLALTERRKAHRVKFDEITCAQDRRDRELECKLRFEQGLEALRRKGFQVTIAHGDGHPALVAQHYLEEEWWRYAVDAWWPDRRIVLWTNNEYVDYGHDEGDRVPIVDLTDLLALDIVDW